MIELLMRCKFVTSSLSLCLVTLAVVISSITPAQAVSLQEHPKLQAIADELIAEKQYTQTELDSIFARATIQQSVLDAMMNPAEYKFTWGKYRKLFLQEDRIQQGALFWQQHQAVFERAEKEYGVPASMIASIVGVESKYGKFKGRYKVLDSLVSLVVGFPRRSAFFAKELKHFLILSKENQLATDEILGSYAGAVGYPQFISSSYRHYAVDFSGDRVTDLINQPEDAIGSIANYFVENGWQKGEPVTSKAHQTVSSELQALANRKRKIQFTAQALKAKGAQLDSSIADTEKLNVLMLDASEVVNEPRSSNTYIVRSGDTACGIARKFKITCSALFKLNKLNKKGDIFRGQRLVLPALDDASKETAKRDKKSGSWVVNKANTKHAKTTASKKAKLGGASEPLYFYTHENFYVITRYNQSVLYAMAVYDLSEAIADAKRELDAASEHEQPALKSN